MNVQLNRIDSMIKTMRRQKKRVLEETAGRGLRPIRPNSPDFECGTHVMYTFDSAPAACQFAGMSGGKVLIDTGRHVYTEWDPVLAQRGAPHPALNPYTLKANAKCRKNQDMNMKSLDILRRTVMLTTHPDFSAAEIKALIGRIKIAAEKVLAS